MSPSQPQPQQAFHPFPLLPPEIRLQIWHYASPPRTIRIQCDPDLKTYTSLSTRPPPALHTNRESRTAALQNISALTFRTGSHAPPRIYLNPLMDTLYVPRCRAMGYDETLREFYQFAIAAGGEGEGEGEKRVLDEFRRIAIDHVSCSVKRPWEGYNQMVFLRGFPRLEEVVLVLGEEKELDGGAQEGEEEKEGEKEEYFLKSGKDPEDLSRISLDFRKSMLAEEKILEDVCLQMGREYVKWSLPLVKIRVRSRRRE